MIFATQTPGDRYIMRQLSCPSAPTNISAFSLRQTITLKHTQELTRVSWTAKKANQPVAVGSTAGRSGAISAAINQGKKAEVLLACAIRKQEESSEKDILEGTMPGSGHGEEADQGYHGEITLGIGLEYR